MLVKNLQLKFVQTKEDKTFLVSENGLEFVFPASVMEQYADHQEPVYLSIDQQPIISNEEKQKEVLNDLLNNQD